MLLQQWAVEEDDNGQLEPVGNSRGREQQSVGWPKGKRWGGEGGIGRQWNLKHTILFGV